MSEKVRDLKLAVEAVGEHVCALRVATEEDVAEFVELLADLDEVEAQLAGLRLHLIGEARHGGALEVLDRVRTSPRATTAQSSASVRLAGELSGRFWVLAEALRDGALSLAQAEAIVYGLKKLPGMVGDVALERCQRELLGFCDRLGPHELRIAATRMWELLDPEGAEQEEADRLDREARRAKARRYFRLSSDFHGSVKLSGSLPAADAALLEAQLEALIRPASKYRENGEAVPDRDTRRADALVELAALAASTEKVPAQGGDRPHVHILLPWTMLLTGLGRAEILNLPGEQLTPGEARRLACDAEIIPIVLGSKSEPLDVGQAERWVTKPIRAALRLRDRGCAFPSCGARVAACEAHHIQPWWDGGVTSFDNLVLLCPHHHRLVEPDPREAAEWQWQVVLDPVTGQPWFIPPRQIDITRTRRRHRRFEVDDLLAPDSAGVRPEPEKPPEPRPKFQFLEPADDPWHEDYVPPERRARSDDP